MLAPITASTPTVATIATVTQTQSGRPFLGADAAACIGACCGGGGGAVRGGALAKLCAAGRPSPFAKCETASTKRRQFGLSVSPFQPERFAACTSPNPN